jgi:hypothetical protein
MFHYRSFGSSRRLWAAPAVVKRRNLPQFVARHFHYRNLPQTVAIRRNCHFLQNFFGLSVPNCLWQSLSN